MSENRPQWSGPWVQAAVFCSLALTDQTGAISFIRVIDRVTHSPVVTDPHAEMQPFEYQITIGISLKAGSAIGSETIEFRREEPSGLQTPVFAVPMLFEAPDRGVNMVLEAQLQFSTPGLYWFDVVLGDHVLTRMPLRIVYAPVSANVR